MITALQLRFSFKDDIERRSVRTAIVWLVVALFVSSATARAVTFDISNLVNDTSLPPPTGDSDLVNPWGVSFLPTGPFWISDNGTNKATLYNVDPATHATAKQGLVVSIPGNGVTGQVFNPSTAQFGGNLFLFATESGAIAGWQPSFGTTAQVLSTAPGAVYKGAALATTAAGNSYLYAANFGAGTIDVTRGTAATPNITGTFTDPTLPSGYRPFNIQKLGDHLYVAYAQPNPNDPIDDLKGAGLGVVNQFDLQGNFENRIATGGDLNAPWGLAIAPSTFGEFAGKLLVGNFGDGTIHVFDVDTEQEIGTLLDANGKPISIDGLWALTPGNGFSGGDMQSLFFTAGPEDETHGLFGVLTAVPEPSTFVLFGFGLLGLLLARRRLS